MKKYLIFLVISLVFISCGEKEEKFNPELEKKMNSIAEQYVKLVLRIGKFDENYVDAYYGPSEWKNEVDSENIEKDTAAYLKLNQQADDLLTKLESLKDLRAGADEKLRYRFLSRQLLAVKGKIFMLRGGNFTFEEEARTLYDSDVPVKDTSFFSSVLAKIDKLIPGKDPLDKRISEFRKKFIIPGDKIDAVFQAAVSETRKRTLENIKLPEGENFKIEYVTGKPWGGYNWYKGNAFSVIQVNTDLPIYIDRAVDLAAHEGYPGHHVYNALLEQNMVKNNKWMEFTVYPLYSPQSLISEGTANFGINVVFPGNERKEFEKKVLFPIAGLDASLADKYYELQELTADLGYTMNEAARNYINGKWTREQAADFLVKYGLSSKEKAERNLKFIDAYRSYVINYNVGEDLVKNYVISKGGTDNRPVERWRIFEYLLKTPQTPSGLK